MIPADSHHRVRSQCFAAPKDGSPAQRLLADVSPRTAFFGHFYITTPHDHVLNIPSIPKGRDVLP